MNYDEKTAEFISSTSKFVDEVYGESITSIGSLDNAKMENVGRLCLGVECLEDFLWEFAPAKEAICELGLKRARLQSGWQRTETEKGVYDFAWQDEVVNYLVEHGVRPWVSLSFGNKLYRGDDTRDKTNRSLGLLPIHTQESRNAWVKFVRTFVERYKGKIFEYEIWNEPDIFTFCPYENWAETYMELVKLTAPVIREADPDAVIISNTGHLYNMEPLLKLGIGDYCDIHAYHNYRPLPEAFTDATRECALALVKKYAPHMKLWRGEAGCPSYNAPTSQGALHYIKASEKSQAVWLSRHLVWDLADENVGISSIFNAYDCMHFTRIHRYYYGLIRDPDCSKKPSYYAVQLIKYLLDNETRVDKTKTLVFTNKYGTANIAPNEVNIRSLCFEKNGSPIYVYWYPGELDKDYEVKMCNVSFFPEVCVKKPVIIDLLTRKVYEVKNEDGILTKLPYTNYPFILTEYDLIKDICENDVTISTERLFDNHESDKEQE